MVHEYEMRAIQRRRLERRLRLFAKSKGYDLTTDQVEEACDMAIVQEAAEFGGPMLDLLAKLLQDFIDNPEKWLKIIMTIISLF